jgi:histidinol-phosphate aminotransferase
MDIDALVQPHLRRLTPYQSARDDFSGRAHAWLDANEYPFSEDGRHRYPDPHHRGLKNLLAQRWQVAENRLFVGHGSDEAIDLLVRLFCRPGEDSVLTFPPTYGMYGVSAGMQNVELLEVPLTPDSWRIDFDALDQVLAQHAPRLLFLCSPNNPTGHVLTAAEMEGVLARAPGLVVLDEAYIDFCPHLSFQAWLSAYEQLVVLRTFSKAWGMAGWRIGVALGHPQVARWMEAVKAPYNLSAAQQEAGERALATPEARLEERRAFIGHERRRLAASLEALPLVDQVFPSQANFLLVRFRDAAYVFQALLRAGVVVRDRSRQVPGCLRITVGSAEENQALLEHLHSL